ncbi:MAG: depupylase/deamidase Dop [Corynebacterium sp.]|nr:depupylase/deamidase Dop [Corynebacterium sp.]
MTRFLGTEIEYGISTPDNPALSPIITSTHLVVAYSGKTHRTRWDFGAESPLKDSRGFDLRRYHTAPVVHPHALGVANVVTSNGARFYVDHAHPEYSSPETTNAWDAMIFELAGNCILRDAVELVADLTAQGQSILEDHPPCPPLKIYKNNVDGKGASYGAHENYLYYRSTGFNTLAQALIPFLVTRQIIIGAGRVGLGQRGEIPGYQISQRADYIEQEISLETTLNRGIINTRDESHATEELARLHVIIGDANMSHTSIFLKLGMTKLVIDAVESEIDFSDLALEKPVRENINVSRDLTCTHRLRLRDGRTLTAIEILREYRNRVVAKDAIDRKVLELWEQVLNLLESNPLTTAHLLDWTAKLSILQAFKSRGIDWPDPKMALIDLQYADIDPNKGLYYALVRKKAMVELVNNEEILHAVHNPPETSRAYLRGRVLARFGDDVLAATWDSLTLRSGNVIHIPQPGAGTFFEAGSLVENAQNADEIAALFTSTAAAP